MTTIALRSIHTTFPLLSNMPKYHGPRADVLSQDAVPSQEDAQRAKLTALSDNDLPLAFLSKTCLAPYGSLRQCAPDVGPCLFPMSQVPHHHISRICTTDLILHRTLPLVRAQILKCS